MSSASASSSLSSLTSTDLTFAPLGFLTIRAVPFLVAEVAHLVTLLAAGLAGPPVVIAVASRAYFSPGLVLVAMILSPNFLRR